MHGIAGNWTGHNQFVHKDLGNSLDFFGNWKAGNLGNNGEGLLSHLKGRMGKLGDDLGRDINVMS